MCFLSLMVILLSPRFSSFDLIEPRAVYPPIEKLLFGRPSLIWYDKNSLAYFNLLPTFMVILALPPTLVIIGGAKTTLIFAPLKSQ